MKTEPIVPARRACAAGKPCHAAESGGTGQPRVGQRQHQHQHAQHVFLQGNQLPQRWAGRAHFTVLDTGFGLGHNFLTTWLAWRADPARCTRLHVVSLELHPPTRNDLAREHADAPPAWQPLINLLLAAWPPLTPNQHALDFDGGRVRLLLSLGDPTQCLLGLQLQADAFYLNGFTTASNPQDLQPRMLKALAGKAAPGATLAAGCDTAALRHGLQSAGFVTEPTDELGGSSKAMRATYAPAFVPRRPGRAAPVEAPVAVATQAQATAAATTAASRAQALACDAVVIGAGIAGAAAAQALAQLGLRVTVVDRHQQPAQEASGNPAGLFHGSVHAGDGSYARLYRAAALQAGRVYAPAVNDGGVPGSVGGLLRLAAPGDDLATLQAVIQRLGLPPDYVSAVGAGAASRLAGVPLPSAAWLYAGGGWIAPAAWVRHALAGPGVSFVGGCGIDTLQRAGNRWLLLDRRGAVAAASPIVVLAAAEASASLLAPLGHGPWPLHRSRGQVTCWQAADAGAVTPLQLPVAGDGYALPLPDGGLLCGATREIEDLPGPAALHGWSANTAPRLHDHQHNVGRLQRLTSIAAPADTAIWQGRTGWRLHADDRLPIAGALPLPPARMPAHQRLDQARLLPRESGLFVVTALGSRGLTLAPLLGRLVAAQATGTPWPLEQDLADAIDPGRWVVRAARRASPIKPGVPQPALA